MLSVTLAGGIAEKPDSILRDNNERGQQRRRHHRKDYTYETTCDNRYNNNSVCAFVGILNSGVDTRIISSSENTKANRFRSPQPSFYASYAQLVTTILLLYQCCFVTYAQFFYTETSTVSSVSASSKFAIPSRGVQSGNNAVYNKTYISSTTLRFEYTERRKQQTTLVANSIETTRTTTINSTDILDELLLPTSTASIVNYFNITKNVNSNELQAIPQYIRTTAMFFCIVIMIFGIVGNIMVPIVIAKTKDMRNSTNIFLTNLSLADLLVLLICTPTVLVEVNTPPETWVLGYAMCKTVPFVESTVAHASVLTILAISFERYYAICEPLKAGYVCTKTRAIVICMSTWGIAALFTSPMLWVADYERFDNFTGASVAVCLTQATNNWRIAFFIMTISAFFLLPLVVLLALYGVIAKNLVSNDGRMLHIRYKKPEFNLKARKQVVLMLGAVVLSFFLCLLPFRVFTLWIILSAEQTIQDIGIERYYMLLYFCRIMLYLNSAMNPILYNLMSTKFRKGFAILCCSLCRNILVLLTFGKHDLRTHDRRGTLSITGGATNTTTSSNITFSSSSMLSRKSNTRYCEENTGRATRLKIELQMPYGKDTEMIAMLHNSSQQQQQLSKMGLRCENDNKLLLENTGANKPYMIFSHKPQISLDETVLPTARKCEEPNLGMSKADSTKH